MCSPDSGERPYTCSVPWKLPLGTEEGRFKMRTLLLRRHIPRSELLPWLGGAVEALL